MIDYKHSQACQARNIKHADNPCVGDYWHEMFTAIARILKVDDDNVTLQHLPLYVGKEITDTDPIPKLMSRAEFAKWIRYSSMPDKTWADVVPERFPPK
jgi:hypothetical protein